MRRLSDREWRTMELLNLLPFREGSSVEVDTTITTMTMHRRHTVLLAAVTTASQVQRLRIMERTLAQIPYPQDKLNLKQPRDGDQVSGLQQRGQQLAPQLDTWLVGVLKLNHRHRKELEVGVWEHKRQKKDGSMVVDRIMDGVQVLQVAGRRVGAAHRQTLDRAIRRQGMRVLDLVVQAGGDRSQLKR